VNLTPYLSLLPMLKVTGAILNVPICVRGVDVTTSDFAVRVPAL